MSKFYVDVSLNRNEVLFRGYENGRRIQESVEYKPYIFIPSRKETKFKTLEGNYVDKLEFDSIREARDFVKKYEGVENFKIYGLTNFDYLFIYDNFPGKIEFDPSLISLVVCDIETDSSHGFPDISLADKAITAITLKKNGKALTFGLKFYKSKNPDVCYVLCKDEQDLLRKFLYYWNTEEWMPDVLSGWNIDHFDIPYLVNRISRILSEEDAKKLSPWGKLYQKKVFIKGREVEMFVPVGIQVLDYMEVYKKFSFKVQESYALNYIAYEVLEEQKVDYSEYGSLNDLYEKNFELFIDYNIHDCTLIERLEEKLGMIKQIFMTAYMTKVNFSDMFATVRPWDGLIHSYLLDRGIVVPQVENKLDQAFEGGYVKDVVSSKYNWLVSFDVTSMYPHIVMSQNISPETYLGRLPHLSTDQLLDGELEKYRDEIKKNDYSVAGNMCCYRRDVQGFLPALMKQIFDSRNEFKKKKKEAEKKYELKPSEQLKKDISTFDVTQQALKIIANSGYGAVSNKWFRFFSIANAQAITLTGQLTIRWVEKKLNEYMNKILKTTDQAYVIYVDTDSNYLDCDLLMKRLCQGKDLSKQEQIDLLNQFCEKMIIPRLEEWFNELGNYLNVYQQKIEMKREAIADRGVWRGSKNYILNVWDNEGVRYKEPKIKIVGIEAVKSSTPGVCRKAIKDVFKIIMNGEYDEMLEYVEKFKKEFDTLEFEDIAFPRGIKVLNDYGDAKDIYRKGTPAHVRASLLYNHYLKKNKLDNKYPLIYNSDKIKFMYLKSPNPIGDNVIAVSDVLPKEFGLEKYLDRERQFQQSFLDVIESILEIVDWPLEQKASLEDFF